MATWKTAPDISIISGPTYSMEIDNAIYFVTESLNNQWTYERYSIKPWKRQHISTHASRAEAQAHAEKHAAKKGKK